jgi:hypothetical protein
VIEVQKIEADAAVAPADVISSCLPRCARHLNAGSKSGPPTASKTTCAP